ncbi:alanine acetyltransferase [Pseudoxanthomonas sp. 10H]|uniref:alanine acetyltransferase n=1 Tax=Pseudoxanthomonas sp. 10H TaxID=3242729 RepID=UPI003557BB9E
MSALSPWSPQQRRWLQALGHVVWRPGGGEPVETAEDPMPPPRAVPPRDEGPRRAPVAPSVAERPSSDAPPATRPGMRRPAGLPDRLQLAMLRASGLDPADPAAREAMAQWPVDRLRGDGAAKRAFWPQLRAMRRRP